MILQVKCIHDDAVIPRRSKEGDAGYDLYSVDNIIIPTGQVGKIHTGVCIGFPQYTWGQIEGRSGLASSGIHLVGGIVDNGYTGEIIVLLKNDSGSNFQVMPGNKIAQLVLRPLITPETVEVDVLRTTQRGDKGFGSTGS